MARQPKTRVQHLADAHEALLKAQASLHAFDARHTSGELRDCIREARAAVNDALAYNRGAVELDLPPARTPRQKASAA